MVADPVTRAIDVLGYQVLVGGGSLNSLGALCHRIAPAHRYAIISDDEVAQHWLPVASDSITTAIRGARVSTTTCPAGEASKTRERWLRLTDWLLSEGAGRDTTVIALGGGVVGDLAGFVAATYLRGVPVIQVPTTLLAMVDASIGGKTGVDTPHGKNLVGAFHQPAGVLVDPGTLATLPAAHVRAGMAEVIKHGLIAESNLLEQVEQGFWSKNWDRSPSYIGELQRLVAQAIQVKINIVQADPFEQGHRSTLNLGHTFAYAIEQVTNNAYRHGEAVSMGLVAAVNLSARLGYCDNALQKRIEGILESVNLPIRIPSDIEPDALLQAMQRDKKKRAGQLRFILLRGIGQAFVSDGVSAREIIDTVSALSD